MKIIENIEKIFEKERKLGNDIIIMQVDIIKYNIKYYRETLKKAGYNSIKKNDNEILIFDKTGE